MTLSKHNSEGWGHVFIFDITPPWRSLPRRLPTQREASLPPHYKRTQSCFYGDDRGCYTVKCRSHSLRCVSCSVKWLSAAPVVRRSRTSTIFYSACPSHQTATSLQSPLQGRHRSFKYKYTETTKTHTWLESLDKNISLTKGTQLIIIGLYEFNGGLFKYIYYRQIMMKICTSRLDHVPNSLKFSLGPPQNLPLFFSEFPSFWELTLSWRVYFFPFVAPL